MAQTTDDQEDLEEGEVITRSYPTEEDLLGLRTTPFQEASPYTKHLWLWYAGQALNAIPSRWNKARTNTLLHEAMTVSDEAFIVTIIVAYEDKWKEAIETPRTARAGRRKGEKWNEQIIKRFTKYYNSISQARDNENANDWEVAFREHCKGLRKREQEPTDEEKEDTQEEEEETEDIPDDL
jgi:hypothetical protein